MADEKEKMQEEIEKANKEAFDTLTEKRKKDFDNETAAYREKLAAERQVAYAAERDKLANKDKFRDPHSGHETTYWEDVLKKADAAINAEQAAYNDWRNAMTSLLSMFSQLNKAMSISIDKTIGIFTLPAKEFLKEKLWHKGGNLFGILPYRGFKDFLLDKIKGEPKLDLPALQQKVQFKEGKVDIEKLKIDNKDIEDPYQEKLNQTFEILVNTWLLENGYKKGSEGKHFDINGIALDKEKFDALNKNPDSSLTQF
ncbi:MAG: hypothetical protein HYX60_09130, partial [Legionella longbeachae]|nr:hypothetical protein [Legionella longbeachae]